MESTTDITNKYIREHPDIKNCLKKGIINYSSLARLISKELKIEKFTSKEAILIAARRFREQLKKEAVQERQIRELLSSSEIEVKNKISVLIADKSISIDEVDETAKPVNKERGLFYFLEGSLSYTIITQAKYIHGFEANLKGHIIRQHGNLVMINIKSSKEIEATRGVVAYLTSLFAENNVNIIEFLSCWTDTIFLIEENDLPRAIGFLKF